MQFPIVLVRELSRGWGLIEMYTQEQLIETGKMENKILQERLRQAQLSFNFTLSLTVVSSLTTVIYLGLLLSGKIPEPKSTAAGGLGSGIVSASLLSLTKNANDRLDRLAVELNDDENKS